MLNPTYQRYAIRLRELINEGRIVTGLLKSVAIEEQARISYQAWITKVVNIVEKVFGKQSTHFVMLATLLTDSIFNSPTIYRIVGLLEGALNDLENGFLINQELLLAGEIFDSVLEQAKFLNQAGYKDPAAVLGRVVLEDALRRISRSEGLDDTPKATILNNDLKKKGRYPQNQWRLIQSWLDIGNAAAHGNFHEYDQGKVERFLEDLERFLSTELRA